MKRFHTLLLITLSLFFVVASCSDKKEDLPIISDKNKSINPISQFVYDGLFNYYLWNDQMKSKKPTVNDTDAKKYFESVLYKTDIKNRWSWITDDVEALLGDFAGESKSFGYSLAFFLSENNTAKAIVKYVFPNSPASSAGLQRLDIIEKINGQPIRTETRDGDIYINQNDFDVLFGNNGATFTLNKFTNEGIVLEEIQVTPSIIKTDPVLFDNIYTEGDKKIGYLFYTNFITNYNDRLFEVFSKFHSEKVTDLVLDLRYNPGGDISAASYLVSLFAPKAAVEEKAVLTTLSYNNFLNDYYDQNNWSRNYKLGVYQKEDRLDNKGNILAKAAPNPIDANLNLNKVYIIATNRSASASELVTFCSRAIMGDANVVHIGGKTSGKYTASWTIHPYSEYGGRTVPLYVEDDLLTKQKDIFKNWAMQPIVAIYTDKDEESFIDPGYLAPNYPLDEGFGYIDYWKPIGDTEDVFLGQALYLITDDESYKPVEPTRPRSSERQMIELKSGRDVAKPLILDNVRLTPEDFNRITEMREQENKKD